MQHRRTFMIINRVLGKLKITNKIRHAVRSHVKANKQKPQLPFQQVYFSSDADAAFLTQGEDKFAQNPIYYHKGSSVLHMSTAYKRLVEGIGGQAWPTAADREANKNITEVILTAKNAPAVVDPRAPIHFEPAGIIESPATPSMNGNWDGTDPGHVASGVGAAMDNGQFVSDFSKIGPWYYETIDRKYPLFKYSELCFLKAIAIQLGLTSGDAKTEYEAGVRSSMTELGVPESKIENYLASTSPNYYGTTAKYDDVTGTNNTPMDKILTQKYIAQFQECSFETWADHRQFHKPTLMPFANVSSSVFNMNPSDQANNTPNAYIKRIYYPSSEYTVNEANVKEAEKRMGGSISTDRSTISSASSQVSYHIFFPTICGHSSAVKLRFLPGAILAAIMAASIGNVPLPQKGSTRILPPFQGVSMISDAARFSAMGAFAVSFRYPLLCRDSPVLSSPTVTSSFIKATLIKRHT